MDCINNLLENINNEHETLRGNDNDNLSPVNRDINLNIHRKKGTVDYNTDYKNSVTKSKYMNSNQNNNRINNVTKNDIYNNVTSLDSFDMSKFNKGLPSKPALTKSSINKMLNSKIQELTFVPNNKEIKISKNLTSNIQKTSPEYVTQPKNFNSNKQRTKTKPIQKKTNKPIQREFNAIIEQDKYDSYFEKKHQKEYKKTESIETIQKRNNNLIESYIRTPNVLMNTNGKEFSSSIDVDETKEKNYEQSNNKYSSFTFTPNVILPQDTQKTKNFTNKIEPNFSINSRTEQREPNRSIKTDFYGKNTNIKKQPNLESNSNIGQKGSNRKINNVTKNINRIEPNFGFDTRSAHKNMANKDFYQDSRNSNNITQNNYNNKINSYNQFNQLNLHNSEIIPTKYDNKKSSREDYNNKFQQFSPLACTMTHNEYSTPQFNQDSKKISREDNNNRFQSFAPLGNTMAYNINNTNYVDGISKFSNISKKEIEASKKVYKPLPKNIPGDPTLNSSVKLNTGQLLPMDTRNTYKFQK